MALEDSHHKGLHNQYQVHLDLTPRYNRNLYLI
jgi:hypothetical protein